MSVLLPLVVDEMAFIDHMLLFLESENFTEVLYISDFRRPLVNLEADFLCLLQVNRSFWETTKVQTRHRRAISQNYKKNENKNWDISEKQLTFLLMSSQVR